jgi:CspA family cold shock protein
VKRLQRALGLESSIERREDAEAIRLGAVDDAVAAERLDDRGGKGRSERSTPREREHGPRGFERGARGNRSVSDRPRPERNAEHARPARGFSDRPERAPRVERSFAERTPRPERNDRAPRAERVFTDRAPRTDRSSTRNAPYVKGANAARGNEAVVSFFNDAKGFGFASDDKGDDLFIHFSNIVGDGFKSLAQGQKITFEEANGPKGREARNVRAVGGGRERRR